VQHQVERGNQSPGSQIIEREQLVAEQDAGSFDSGVVSVICAVEAQAAIDVDAGDAGCFEPVGPGRKLGAAHERFVVNQGEVAQILGVLEATGLGQQARAAQRQHIEIGQPLDHQARRILVHLHVANGDIDAVAREIGQRDRRGDACVDFRVSPEEAIEPRRQPFRREARRRADDQHRIVVGPLDVVDSLPDLKERRIEAGIQQLAGLGQSNRSRAAVEQLQAEELLQPFDLVTEGSRRDVQLASRAGQAQVTGGSLESTQGIQRWECPMHENN